MKLVACQQIGFHYLLKSSINLWHSFWTIFGLIIRLITGRFVLSIILIIAFINYNYVLYYLQVLPKYTYATYILFVFFIIYLHSGLYWYIVRFFVFFIYFKFTRPPNIIYSSQWMLPVFIPSEYQPSIFFISRNVQNITINLNAKSFLSWSELVSIEIRDSVTKIGISRWLPVLGKWQTTFYLSFEISRQKGLFIFSFKTVN